MKYKTSWTGLRMATLEFQFCKIAEIPKLDQYQYISKGGGQFRAGQCFWAIYLILTQSIKYFLHTSTIGPSFRCCILKTQLLLLPCLLPPLPLKNASFWCFWYGKYF